MDNFSYHKENIKNFAVTTIINCRRIYNLLSDELDREKINEHALYGYHSMAYSTFITMKGYYLQNDELSAEEIDTFLAKFEQFSREFISSRGTNHSMQHTFGYYNELVKSYNILAGLLELNPVEVPQ
ncbi:hypothetical protein P5808_03600 [Bacillus cereus]|uniref:hypothetical protein n=1 Tax=Bacillus TaxID=1386 RepID=UPI000A427E17|nr:MULTISPECIES: hypothetical protein [Bacillus]MDF9504707.1 hypothetical protein [Bacillus cereus]MDF9593127.1 hypothetical protein [Bacillus cereus]MDF9609431.1 hypothetical protein [Bacillus cereus]MDF9656245.1 hypothetical protein [Bacillus cereus]